MGLQQLSESIRGVVQGEINNYRIHRIDCVVNDTRLVVVVVDAGDTTE